ncbi:MAG: hypothetical protein L3J74_09035 [Bacteroidales bacterium]|nr:hypothetical protein [Bacteroidales bacterium]
MNNRVKFIEHKGRKIIYLDFSNMHGEDLIKVVHEFEQIVINSRDNKYLCSLTNFTNSHIYGDGLREIKRVAKRVRPFLYKRAVIGITGAKMVLYKMVNFFAGGTPTKLFASIEEAKDYLAKE